MASPEIVGELVMHKVVVSPLSFVMTERLNIIDPFASLPILTDLRTIPLIPNSV